MRWGFCRFRRNLANAKGQHPDFPFVAPLYIIPDPKDGMVGENRMCPVQLCRRFTRRKPYSSVAGPASGREATQARCRLSIPAITSRHTLSKAGRNSGLTGTSGGASMVKGLIALPFL